MVLAAAPSVSGGVRACHDPAVLLQKRCRRPGPGRITPTLWLPAGPCSRMTKCQVVLALPVRAPEPDPPVLSLRKEAADIWAAAGAQKPTLGRGRAVPAEKSRSLPFSFCPPAPPHPRFLSGQAGRCADSQRRASWKEHTARPDHGPRSRPHGHGTDAGAGAGRAWGVLGSALSTAVGASFSPGPGPLDRPRSCNVNSWKKHFCSDPARGLAGFTLSAPALPFPLWPVAGGDPGSPEPLPQPWGRPGSSQVPADAAPGKASRNTSGNSFQAYNFSSSSI